MNIEASIMLIQLVIGATMLVFGIHQMKKPVDWLKYLPPFMAKMSPMKPESQMRMHSVGNIVFGIFLMFGFGFPVVAAWIAFIWWLSILPFAWRLDWTIGMRDLCITLTLLALILLL